MKSARARSKSPFRSFRWPSRKPKAEPDTASAGAAAAYSDDEDNVRGAEYGGKIVTSCITRPCMLEHFA